MSQRTGKSQNQRNYQTQRQNYDRPQRDNNQAQRDRQQPQRRNASPKRKKKRKSGFRPGILLVILLVLVAAGAAVLIFKPAKEVPEPEKVRYMGQPRTSGTLYNEASLPLGPFEASAGR